ncbi:MAG: glycosyltransferase [Clostridiaceae bacterium]|nr:glycosyltransferase [Clostridiaceae bacterium]
MSISAILLAKNEAENLKILLPRLISALNKTNAAYEVIVVDSMTPTDNTPSICSQYDHVRYINQTSPGYAGAFRTGIEAAGMDCLLNLDADGSHNPDAIPDLYEKYREGYDLVIGSRYCQGGKTNDSRMSIIMSKILNFVMRIIIGVKAKDISTSFRIYNMAQIKAVKLTCTNYEVLQEVILRMRMNKRHLTIGEVPIIFEKRIYGQSKRRLMRFIASYISVLFRFTKIRLGHQHD